MTKLQATKKMSWPIAILALPLLLVSCTDSQTTIVIAQLPPLTF